MKKVAERIKELRRSNNLNQVELAKKLKVEQSTISKWERGVYIPDGDNLVLLADVLNTTPQLILGVGRQEAPPMPGRIVEVIGALAAGEWIEAREFDEEERYQTSVFVPRDLETTPLQGLEVRGPSMNLVYPDGSIVYVAPLHALPGAPKSGQIVMVMRRDAHGLTECTLKEFVVDAEGKKWLWPRSNSPEHQAPLNYLGKKRGDVESVEITGVVVAALTFAKR